MEPKRNKKIIKPVVFIAGLLIVLMLLSCYFEDVPNHKLKGIDKEPKDTIDYLVIGDSESYSIISPLEIWKDYGYVGYNCGVSGQRLQNTYYTLEKTLQNQSPKVILLETNEFYRKFNYFTEFETVIRDHLKKVLPVYKYHNSWKTFGVIKKKISKSNLKFNLKLSNTKIFKGFHYNTTVSPYTNGDYVEKTGSSSIIHELPLIYLNKIVTLCKEKHIKLILYSSPSPKCWTYSKHNCSTAFAEKNDLPYIDLNLYNEKIGIDWLKDTRDNGNHLNYFGAKKVTGYMGEYLSEHTDLKDHRMDHQYASWNKALKKYLSLTTHRKPSYKK